MQDLEMRWFVDQFARRRLHDKIIDAAIAALPDVLRRMPDDQPVDAALAAKLSTEIGTALATEFAERGLI